MNNIEQRRTVNSAWYIALIFILLAGLTIWIVMSFKVDLFTEALKPGDPVAILLTVDDGERPWLTEIFLYHPLTHKAALISIPEETGALLESLDRIDALASLYNPHQMRPYREAVAELLGYPANFFIRMGDEEFEKFVDHLGGIEIFIPNPIDDAMDGVRYLFPSGSVTLDGAKSVSFLRYTPPGEIDTERTEREHRIVQAILRNMSENKDLLRHSDVFPFIEDLLDTDMDGRALSSFIEELSSLDTERLILQGILGARRMVDGKELLFPYFDGRLIRETIGRIQETLARAEAFGYEDITVSVEILNGTDVNGLASRTAQIFRNYGFKIAAVKNADRNDYDKTVVLDRRGSPDAAKRVAELIRCGRIHSQVEENRDETVDVSIILGRDFDGRYVKE